MLQLPRMLQLHARRQLPRRRLPRRAAFRSGPLRRLLYLDYLVLQRLHGVLCLIRRRARRARRRLRALARVALARECGVRGVLASLCRLRHRSELAHLTCQAWP